MEGYALELNGVDRTYQMGEVQVPVLKQVSLHIEEGSYTVIIGPSGSGKTTLMNIMGAIDRPDAGQVLAHGQDLSLASDQVLTKYRRENMGFVFQLYNLIPTLTAADNVRVATDIVDGGMDPREALALVGMSDRVDYFPSQLSGGQQQRVAIARALAKRPRLILCDEPTGALDTETSDLVLALLEKLNREQGVTLVLITHNPEIAERGSHLLKIDSGRVVTER